MRRCCFRCVLTSLPVSLLMFLFLAMPGDAIPFPFRAYPSPISSRELQLDPCFALLSVLSYLPVRPSDFSGRRRSVTFEKAGGLEGEDCPSLPGLDSSE
ncbi:hypothetical protein MUK42_10502 [Musa troglodytarum]|uniref:Transmembrane protein n=1 Tax=Musa troglodytarum TaxID=320322 RepID=A0A9E7H067_9LILI|nr:hypothetical protein MUK42_10502 [Musa troglodytarum]URE21453.1 hypothetical protein MUK42_10502 [Musa troglodytarum]